MTPRRAARGRLNRPNAALLRVVVALVASRCAAPALASAPVEILVPAYFYPVPGSPWDGLISAAARGAPVTAIMNPGNGPGTVVDPSYTAVVTAFRAAGGRVIGYVYTSYTARPLATVLADIDTFASFYALDGVFVDEMDNSGAAANLDYYQQIYDHVKAIDAGWLVVGNPGTTTLEPYLTRPTADVLVVHENLPSVYAAYVPSAWNFNHAAGHFCHLVHSEPSAVQMLADIDLATQRRAAWVYITDDVLVPNPWDTLPAYWDAQVERVMGLGGCDTNCDGSVNPFDIQPFVQLLSAGPPPPCSPAAGDANVDGTVNPFDINAFLACLGS